jgi:hypothetical protein
MTQAMSNLANPANVALNTASEAIDAKIKDIIDKAAKDLGTSKAAAFAPILSEYGPVFARMAQDEIVAWIQTALNGAPIDAYDAIVKKMDDLQLTDQWSVLREQWKAANKTNMERMAYRQKLAGAVLEAFVSLALASVSL